MVQRHFVRIVSLGFASLMLIACGGRGAPSGTSGAGAPSAPGVGTESQKAVGSQAPKTAESQEPIKLKMAYAAVASGFAPYYVAYEGGYFRKHGIDAEMTFISGSQNIATAMIAGDIDVGFTGGATVVGPSLEGADIVELAATANNLVYALFAQPQIRSVSDLRGRTIGITRFGSNSDMVKKMVLTRYGLDPDRDVNTVQVGGQPEQLAALQAGAIDVAILSPPASARARKAGYPELVTAQELRSYGVEYPTAIVAARRSWIQRNEEAVRRLLRGLAEGVNRWSTDKEYALQILGQYTKLEDREALEDSYAFESARLNKGLLPTEASIRTFLEELSTDNPRAMDARPADFLESKYVKELHDSGFMRQLFGS